MKRAILLVILSMLAGACARGLLTSFPHRLHLATLKCGAPGQPECLSCPSCHQAESEPKAAWSPPTAQRCAGCHVNDALIFGRSVRPALATLPAGKKILFPHQPHLELGEIKGQCVKCHGGAVGVAGGAPLFPPMETCLGCHRHRQEFEGNVCTTCHRPGELRGLEPRSFLPHDAAWMKRHGQQARTSPEKCATCHAQTSCDSCHDSTRPLGPATRNPEQLERSFAHRFDFLSRHALEARSQPGQCATCHARTECDACHAVRGVSGAVSGGQSPHPFGWASGLGAAGNSHGLAARRDLGACASCHDQGPSTNCVRCHKAGAMGGTPHPFGWRSTESISAPQCAACHGGAL